MKPGDDRMLFLLAFDHRASFKKRFGADPARLEACKRLVFEGFLCAIAQGAPQGAGILVDEEMGSDVAMRARQERRVFALPVEKSGQLVFEFEYGDDFGGHIEEFDPTFAKVLVRWNPGDAAVTKKAQGERLKKLSDWLHDNGRSLLFELLVPATRADLGRVEGDLSRYDADLRPVLTVKSITEIHDAGVEPDIWKIEGMDRRQDCEQLAAAIRSDGRDAVSAVVLGRGADRTKVDHWLRQGAPVDGYRGFAIGRSIWTKGVQAFLGGEVSRTEAAELIASSYQHFINVYTTARSQ